MKLELFYYYQCPFCQRVLRTIEGLNISDKISLRNTLENRDDAKALQELTGRRQVPCLVIDGKPMLESADINRFLISQFG